MKDEANHIFDNVTKLENGIKYTYIIWGYQKIEASNNQVTEEE